MDNAGTIVVPLGKIGLGAGERVTLDLSGDGFLQVAIPTTAAGSSALLANSGRILAEGGLIQLSAAAARDMARQAINMSGVIEARSVGGVSGDIILSGSGGAVEVSGTLDASGTGDAGGTGGAITVTGRDIALQGASLDVSGANSGGVVRLAGGRQGAGDLPHADTLTVDAASSIRADATTSGQGGDVVLWSDVLTSFAGTISARGGALSGNGGQAEVSGKARLDYTGFTDLSAAHGSFGTLLLDPYNVTISTGADTSGFTASGDDSVINVATLLTALGGANVVISTGAGGSQTGDITVAAPLTWNSGTTLTLDAYHSIAINSDIAVAGSGGLVLTTNDGGSGGDLYFGSGASVSYVKSDGTPATTSQGGTLNINGVSYTLLYSMADIQAIASTSLSGSYALANDLDASGTTYTDALVTGMFTGSFEGLNHIITGLTINKSGDDAGMFDTIGPTGKVRNLGLLGGSVSGAYSVGFLAGLNMGAVSNVFSTGSVSGDTWVGGLVGDNYGTITNSYATGAVRGNDSVGGLVGYHEAGATLSNSYSTGTVHCDWVSGGFVGYQYGTISNSYWDTTTSGTTTGLGDVTGGSASVTGLTTAQLQDGSSAAGLGAAFTLTSGLYPYQTRLFPDGVQVVSGYAYTDGGSTPLASGGNGAGLVRVRLGDGTALAASTGANGYYYAFSASAANSASPVGR